jgi:hypothetical protein
MTWLDDDRTLHVLRPSVSAIGLAPFIELPAHQRGAGGRP